MTAIVYLLFAAGCYLLGAIPFGLIMGRLTRGVDIRDYGSGKTGMTNTLRTLGKGPAILVLLLDVLKGALPVVLARSMSDNSWLQVVGALAAIAGHDWPIYAGFRGGRGVATSLGAMTAMAPLLGPITLIVAVLVLIPTRIVSLMSVVSTLFAAALFLILARTGYLPGPYAAFAAVAGPLVVFLHRDNIRRLLAGTEPKMGQGGSRRPI